MLRRIVAKYGSDLGGNARRSEGLLKDLCGEYRREINVLTNAIDERVPLDLMAAGKSVPRELLLTRLARRLEDNLGLTPEAAVWAVDSWALALGVLSDAEVETREKKQTSSPPPTIAAPKNPVPPPQNPGIQSANQNRQPQRQPQPPPQRQQQRQRPPQPLPKPPPQIFPPVARKPVNVPMPAPPAPMQRTSGANAGVSQTSPQPVDQTNKPVRKSLFRRFFGCLLVIFLLVTTGAVLLFGVPYAIEVMRETQRQNEAPRFPRQ